MEVFLPVTGEVAIAEVIGDDEDDVRPGESSGGKGQEEGEGSFHGNQGRVGTA